MLRHSKLTEYATSVPDQVLKNYAGWTPDSPMASKYIHLSGKDVTPAILKHHGLGKAAEQKPQETSKLCLRCKHLNQLDNKYCDKCSLALSVEAFEEMQQKEREKEQQIKKLNDRVQEMEITMGVVRPLLGQLAKETKTNRFVFTGPEGDKIGTILTKDLRKIDEETKKD